MKIIMRSGFLLNANLGTKDGDENDIFADAPDLGPLRDVRSTFVGRWGSPTLRKPVDNLGTAQKQWSTTTFNNNNNNNNNNTWNTIQTHTNNNDTPMSTSWTSPPPLPPPSLPPPPLPVLPPPPLPATQGWLSPASISIPSVSTNTNPNGGASIHAPASPVKDPWSHITEIPAHVNPSTYYHETASSSSTMFEGVPLLPKTLGEPKNALSSWYGKRHKCVVPKSCFTTWDDGGKSHVRKFTSVFTCPITKEQFGSGTLAQESDCVTLGDVVYYGTKKMAEHAAAARALDCMSYREHNGTMHYGLCQEQPYHDGPPANKRFKPNIGVIGDARPMVTKQST